MSKQHVQRQVRRGWSVCQQFYLPIVGRLQSIHAGGSSILSTILFLYRSVAGTPNKETVGRHEKRLTVRGQSHSESKCECLG